MLDEMQRMLDDGDVESIRLWLDAGVDVDITNGDGMTPLYGASHKGQVPLVRVLLDAGADQEKATLSSNVFSSLAACPRLSRGRGRGGARDTKSQTSQQ